MTALARNRVRGRWPWMLSPLMAMTVNVHVNLAPRPAPEKFAKFANFDVSVPRTPSDAASYQRGRPVPCHPEATSLHLQDLVIHG
jgi:hypothetical protein